eukprot:scaffold189701_cov44-Prasinocladus_malaysianus.AAC.1
MSSEKHQKGHMYPTSPNAQIRRQKVVVFGQSSLPLPGADGRPNSAGQARHRPVPVNFVAGGRAVPYIVAAGKQYRR